MISPSTFFFPKKRSGFSLIITMTLSEVRFFFYLPSPGCRFTCRVTFSLCPKQCQLRGLARLTVNLQNFLSQCYQCLNLCYHFHICSNRKFAPVGIIHSFQNSFFFFSDKYKVWQLDQTKIKKKKNSAAPPGIKPGYSDCQSDVLTTELRSFAGTACKIFVFDQAASSFFTRWPGCSSSPTSRHQQNERPIGRTRFDPQRGCAVFFFHLIQPD